ncbi:hypothetical protein V491_02693 [Pseudogymnoascus sp. VKM F-3775]|nr:hypothetical protein V491_02693 [Pseudogymnoascus sp. VKM F-3775]
MSWLRAAVELWLIQKLVSSPTFHRGVRRIHKGVHEFRYGKDPAEMGGTKIDVPGGEKGFLGHFIDELKEQIRGTPTKK